MRRDGREPARLSPEDRRLIHALVMERRRLEEKMALLTNEVIADKFGLADSRYVSRVAAAEAEKEQCPHCGSWYKPNKEG